MKEDFNLALKEPAYLLWCIRSYDIKNIDQLVRLFSKIDFNDGSMTPYHSMLGSCLSRLREANLIEYTGRRNSDSIKITENYTKVFGALCLDLKDVANLKKEDSLILSPVFNAPSVEYRSDVFVLMPFREDIKPIYTDHIKKVCNELSISVARADDFFTSQDILHEIWSAIYGSRIIIADCTHRNPNVFYEIGISHTLGKTVIFTTQNRNDIPFDISSRRYIYYKRLFKNQR